MQRLLEIMRQLRAPNGCPWDKEQTHESLKPYLLEEAAEAVDAIGTTELASELGDVLLQVAFHAVIAEESGDFDYRQIENQIVEKLIRRHPHVFANADAPNSQTVVKNWDAIKKQERGGQEKNAFEKIPAALGALSRCQEFFKIKNKQHQPLPSASLKSKILEALEPTQHSAGQHSAAQQVTEVLEALTQWAESLNVNCEVVLREQIAKNIAQESRTHKAQV